MLKSYVSIDLEMSGLSPVKNRIIEIGAIKVKDNNVVDVYSTLINPNIQIREKIENITGIRNQILKDAPLIGDVMPDLLKFIGNDILLGHSINFDFDFIMQACYDLGIMDVFSRKWYGMDTLLIARQYMDKDIEKKLDKLCAYYGIEDKAHHRAMNDATVTMQLYEKLCEHYEDSNEFKPIQLFYKPKKQSKIAVKQIRFLEKLVTYHGLDLSINFSNLTQQEGSRLADSIILKYGKISR